MDGVGAGELGGTSGEHARVWEGALAPSLLSSSALDPVAAGLADMSVGARTWARPASRARPVASARRGYDYNDNGDGVRRPSGVRRGWVDGIWRGRI